MHCRKDKLLLVLLPSANFFRDFLSKSVSLKMDIASSFAYRTSVSNSTLFPLLLMSLASQKNSPDISTTILPAYDFIVVGGGTSGSVVASRLSEISGVSVLVLEAGPSPPIITDVIAIGREFASTNLDWQYVTVPQKYTGYGLKNNQLKWPGGKVLGGSSVLGAATYLRGNRKDYDLWEEMGAKGWSFDDVLPYFIKLEDNQDPDYLADGFHGVNGPINIKRPEYNSRLRQAVLQAAVEMGYQIVDPNTGIQTGFYDFQSHNRNSQRCSTAKAYLVPAENRDNLDILTNAFVTKVVITNGRADGVLFDYNGQPYFIKANREVIVSAGTINTAQLLMLSGVGPRDELEKFGIPVIADLPVGLNLQDNGAAVKSFLFKPEIEEITKKFSDDENIQLYIDTRTGPLASSEGVASIAILQDDKINPPEDAPNYLIFFTEGSTKIPKKQWNLKDEVYEAVYKPYENQPISICFVQILSAKSRGTVTLQSANPYDPPLIDPNYLYYIEDVNDLVEGLKTCRRVTNNRHMREIIEGEFTTLYPGCEQYASDETAYFQCQVRTEYTTLTHPVGTAKMGDPNDPTTVVDPRLRVKFVQGLRVIDNSIMPIMISSNTLTAAIMIAEKGSDMMKEELLN